MLALQCSAVMMSDYSTMMQQNSGTLGDHQTKHCIVGKIVAHVNPSFHAMYCWGSCVPDGSTEQVSDGPVKWGGGA